MTGFCIAGRILALVDSTAPLIERGNRRVDFGTEGTYRQIRSYRLCLNELLQLRILRFGLLENGDVGVGVFPECEEVPICRLCFGGVALQSVSASQLEMGQCADTFVENDSAMVKNFLEFGHSFAAPVLGQIGKTTNIDGIEGRPVYISQFIWSSRLKSIDGPWSVIAVDRKLCSQSGQIVVLNDCVLRKTLAQVIRQ